MNFDFHLASKSLVCKILLYNYFFQEANDCLESFPTLTFVVYRVC
jgi:hypothetical protein